MLQCESDYYTPVLLTVQNVFTELLRRRDMVDVIDPTKPSSESPLGTKLLSSSRQPLNFHCWT